VINDCEFLEGAAFVRLVNCGHRVTITSASEIHSSIYLIETDTHQSAVLFKHSKKLKSPWSFTFSSQEDDALKVLHSKHPKYLVFIAFICHKDGICCVSEERLKRVLQSLKAMQAQGLQKGRLNVRRGNGDKGLDMARQEPGKWFGYGFGTSKWLTNAKRDYPDVPTLVVAYQKGEKKKNWDDQPLYLPTLVLPKSKFVFMFNYSDEIEETYNHENAA
jgi:hypothetical protein